MMFADSFSILSIHCVARGLGASFLYFMTYFYAPISTIVSGVL